VTKHRAASLAAAADDHHGHKHHQHHYSTNDPHNNADVDDERIHTIREHVTWEERTGDK